MARAKNVKKKCKCLKTIYKTFFVFVKGIIKN